MGSNTVKHDYCEIYYSISNNSFFCLKIFSNVIYSYDEFDSSSVSCNASEIIIICWFSWGFF